MRTRVNRNFTFKAYNVATNELVTRSDNFFTVESHITAILKDSIEYGTEPEAYIIQMESKDGKLVRPIESITTRAGEIFLDYVPEAVTSEVESK